MRPSPRRYRILALASALLAAALPGAVANASPAPPKPHADARHRAPHNFDELDCEGPEEDRLPPNDSGQGGVHTPSGASRHRRAHAPALPTVKWPKNIPDLDDARRMLRELPVRRFDSTGFRREQFGGKNCWVLHGADKCSTRELALKARSEIPVTLRGSCKVVGGRWESAYDGMTVANPLRVDIDHIVPLKVAWGSGARNWPEHKRRAFANDLSGSPQLIAVSTWSNRDKGDKTPDKWLPKGHECLYSRAWIGVKDYYDLNVTRAEKRKLQQVLRRC
ncbi:HNH endonuclease family protein [Streptomyces sichuanensis]|uniref:HNH endonuclease family protein n=1 Tax=Streptomyces sichuanensis TaxID=2871810 RepID=UPI0021F08B2C|nr:HNH endonuclease family protein [Streptomyces sichuanensis]